MDVLGHVLASKNWKAQDSGRFNAVSLQLLWACQLAIQLAKNMSKGHLLRCLSQTRGQKDQQRLTHSNCLSGSTFAGLLVVLSSVFTLGAVLCVFRASLILTSHNRPRRCAQNSSFCFSRSLVFLMSFPGPCRSLWLVWVGFTKCRPLTCFVQPRCFPCGVCLAQPVTLEMARARVRPFIILYPYKTQ